MLTDNHQVSAKKGLCDLAFNIPGLLKTRKTTYSPQFLSRPPLPMKFNRLNFKKHLDKLEKSKRSRLESVDCRNIPDGTARFENALFPTPHGVAKSAWVSRTMCLPGYTILPSNRWTCYRDFHCSPFNAM